MAAIEFTIIKIIEDNGMPFVGLIANKKIKIIKPATIIVILIHFFSMKIIGTINKTTDIILANKLRISCILKYCLCFQIPK